MAYLQDPAMMQPPRHGSAGPPERFQFPGECLDAGAANREQRQRPDRAPAAELARAERAGPGCQAESPGQEPGECKLPGIGERRLDKDQRSWDSRGGHQGTSGQLQSAAREWDEEIARHPAGTP